MRDPAIEGTLNIVQATQKVGIRRIIITLSFKAVFNLTLGGAV